MEFVRTLGLCLALALGPGPAGGHPQPCGVLVPAGGSVRLGALLPRAPAARARVLAALARAALASRLPHNLSLELAAAAPPARDPASLARGLCQALAAPGVAAVLAFPEARPELLQLHFLAAATETPVLSVLRREARAPLGVPVRGDAGIRRRGAPGRPWGVGTGRATPESRGARDRIPHRGDRRPPSPAPGMPRSPEGVAPAARGTYLDPWALGAPRAREPEPATGREMLLDLGWRNPHEGPSGTRNSRADPFPGPG